MACLLKKMGSGLLVFKRERNMTISEEVVMVLEKRGSGLLVLRVKGV